MNPFQIHDTMDLSEGCGSEEILDALKLGQKHPTAKLETWQHPTEGYSTTIIYDGPNVTKKNQNQFDAAVAAHLEI